MSTLGRSTRIFDLLAKCPVTPPDLGVALSREKAILGLRLLSPEVPSTEDLVVSGLPATVSLGPFVEFLVGARHPERWRDPREVAALNRCLAAHVKVEADVCGVRGDTRPQALIIPQDASTPGVKVVVFRRGTSSDAPIVVSRVFFAGLPVASPELPTPGEVWAAANAGDAPRLITALEDGGSADEATEDGTTALVAAVRGGHLATVKALLRSADVAAVDRGAANALHHAAELADASIAALLLSDPRISINALAVRKGLKPDPQFPNSSEHTRYTALHIAAGLGHTETARALLDHPLIDLNIADNEGSDCFTPLHYAAREGCQEIVRMLISTPGVDVNARCDLLESPLFGAVTHGHCSIVSMLISDPRVEITSSLGWTALHYAASSGQGKVVELLLQDPRFDPNAATEEDAETPLIVAAARGCTDVILQLLADGRVRFDERNNRGMSALHCAASGGHLDTLCALMRDPRADVNSGNILIAGRHAQACPCCAEHDDELRGNGGRRPIHYAVDWRHEEVLRVLLDSPAVDVNATDADGKTALHYAANAGNVHFASLIVAHPRANIMIASTRGETALDLAKAPPSGPLKDWESAESRAEWIAERLEVTALLEDTIASSKRTVDLGASAALSKAA